MPYLIFLLPVLLAAGMEPPPGATVEKQLDEGLVLYEYKHRPQSMIYILKIDPGNYDFRLFNAKEAKTDIQTAREWAGHGQLTGVVNAGMFQQDYRTHVGYMKHYDYYNNTYISKDNCMVAFNRKDSTVKPFQIIDLKCQDWEQLRDQYHTFIQGIRMIDCHQKNRWSQQEKKWSMVVIGMDKQGNALFIFSRYPYTVHDFINILLAHPVGIYNAMYLEGGPEASLFLDHPKASLELFGSYETGFMENDDNDRAWPIPNVIGFVKK